MPYNLRRCSAIVNNLLQSTCGTATLLSKDGQGRGRDRRLNPFYDYENDESTGEKNEDVKNNESNGKVKKGENENNPMINPFFESEHGESSEEENEDEKYPVKSRCMDHETSKVSSKKHRSIKIPSVKNLLKCQDCNYSTLWKNHLERHNSKHTGERPKYTSERPHSCTLCTLSFKRPNDLKRHFKILTGEKAFKCKVCGYASRQNRIKEHMVKHTGEKPNRCSICNFLCSFRTGLKRHMLKHTAEKSNKCTKCNFSCTFPSSLKRHDKVHK